MSIAEAQKRELDKLQKRDGTITTAAIIEAAKKPRSTLHGEFNWNVHEAAFEAWTYTARRILREYKLVVTVSESTLIFRPPAFVHDPNMASDESGYKSTIAMKDSKSEVQQALINKAKLCRGHLISLHALAVYWESDTTFIDAAISSLEDFVSHLAATPKSRRKKQQQLDNDDIEVTKSIF